MDFSAPPIQYVCCGNSLLLLTVSQEALSPYLCGYFESYSGELSVVHRGKFTVKETIVETPITQSDPVFTD